MAAAKKTTGRKIKGNSNRGGSRTGAGRKPRPITELNRSIAERSADAIYALDLHVLTMRAAGEDIELRLACAREVMNRVLGKPTEKHEHGSDEDRPIRIVVEYADRGPRDTPDAA